MRKITIVLFTMFLSSAYAEGILMAWSPQDLSGMTQERFDSAKLWSMEEILTKNLDVNTWPEVYLLLIASMKFKDDTKFLAELAKQISNGSETKLGLTSRLIIWERISTDDIIFEGKGMQVDDDLYKVGGRANFILRNLTKKNYGLVSIKSSEKYLKNLMQRWKKQSKGDQVEQYINPYEGIEKALDETHSLVALQALIHSLKPSDDKNKIISSCLKTLYKLDELPKDKTNPAIYCNPDTYTLTYLAKLIGETNTDESRDYNWWTAWWNNHKDNLKWNSVRSIFETS